jgi:phenylacetate-coenzyme A ligase PaaK-like adenylate-forming protein
MDYLTGEYEAFLYGDDDEATLRVRMECKNAESCDKDIIEDNFIKTFLKYKPGLQQAHTDGTFNMIFDFTEPEGLEFYRIKGRPKRLVDRR